MLVSNASDPNSIRYEALINALPYSQLLVNKAGLIVFANTKSTFIFDYSHDELMQLNQEKLLDASTFSFSQILQTLHEAKEISVEINAFKKDGTRFPISVVFTELWDELLKETLIVASITAKTLLDKSNNILSEACKLAKLGGWELNLVKEELFWTDTIKEIHEVEKLFVPDFNTAINFYNGTVSKNKINAAVQNAIETGEGFDLNLEIITAKGNIKIVNALGEAITEGGIVTKLVGTFQDITKKEEIYNSLFKSYIDLNKIMDTSLDIISVVNDDGEFLQLSKAAEKIWGYSIDELMGKKNTDLVVPEDLEKTYDIIDKIKHGAEVINFENRYRHKNGKMVSMSWSATIDPKTKLRYAIGRDITEKVNRENQLKLFESVITNANDSVVITEATPIDKPGPIIVYVNKAFEKMTLYNKDEVIGQSPRLLQGPETDQQELHKLKQHLHNWEVCETEIINYKKNGEAFWINFTVVPVADEKGWFTHWIAIQKDVTERKKLEVEKNKLINELVENNKDLKQFSYITSHNLRAPVTNLLALIKLFDWTEIKDEDNKNLLLSFEKSAKQLNDSINDLLNILVLKEKKIGAPELVDLQTVLNNTLVSFKVLTNDLHVQFNIEFSGAKEILFIKEYLESIFTNLISNALKYYSPNRQPIIDIRSYVENNYVVVQFKDNGLGIDLEKNKSKIFKLFQTFHQGKESRGIGLYLIQTQLNALGGKIEIESEVDKGTSFFLYFKQ